MDLSEQYNSYRCLKSFSVSSSSAVLSSGLFSVWKSWTSPHWSPLLQSSSDSGELCSCIRNLTVQGRYERPARFPLNLRSYLLGCSRARAKEALSCSFRNGNLKISKSVFLRFFSDHCDCRESCSSAQSSGPKGDPWNALNTVNQACPHPSLPLLHMLMFS